MNTIFASAAQRTLQLISATTTARPTIILGLSGGPDSVFLFHVLTKLQTEGYLSLVAAHLDHEWRTSSGADALFCANLCNTTGVTLVNTKASSLNLPIKFNGSKEDIGRRLRRHFFEQVRQHHGATFIALAHHRQDQQETFFVRLARGTTLNGLTCMKAIDGHYLRPLLKIGKDAIIEHLTKHNHAYCIDPSNEADTYLRNRIRNYITPILKNIDPRFEQKLASTITHLQAEDEYLQALAQENFERIFTHKTGSLPEFKKLHPVMQRRILLLWLITNCVPFSPSTAYLNELLRFITSPSGGRHRQGTWAVVKQGKNLQIEHDS